MKKLTQDVFENAPEWVRSAAVSREGLAYFYECKASELHPHPYRHAPPFTASDFEIANMDFYDTTNWQNSAIDREVQP